MQLNREVTIVLAGGGTGGHLFPGIAVAQELRARHPQWRLVFIGTSRGIETRAVPQYQFDLELLAVQPLRGRGIMGALQGLWAVPKACLAARRTLRRLRPAVALGVGGYAAGPALLTARMMGIPTMIMEQNAHAGLTNRLLGRVVRHILLAMPNLQLGSHKHSQVVGNPVRRDLVALRADTHLYPAAFTQARPLRILVVGGSQGAHALNEAVTALLPQLIHLPVTLRHQTGSRDHAAVLARYGAYPNIVAQVSPFIDDMAQAYREADVLVCRSGASTLAELAVVGLPAVFVPYPSAADDHQTANAQVMVSQGGGVVLPEAELSPEALLNIIRPWLASPAVLSEMAARAWAFGKPDAVGIICDIIEAEVQRV